MNAAPSNSEQRTRILRAVAIVFAMLLAIPCVNAMLEATSGLEQTTVAEGIDSKAIMRFEDPFDALDILEGMASADGAEIPEALSQEVGFIAGARDIRIDASGTVIGYSVSGQSSGTLANLTEHMRALGWSSVPLGGMEGATFVKQDGEYTWALATCTQAGDSTSVVVRCMKA